MYSKDLINRIKILYRDSPDIIRLAEEGNRFLGRWLDDSSTDCISTNEIMAATSLEELQNKALTAIARRDLYNRWCLEDNQLFLQKNGNR